MAGNISTKGSVIYAEVTFQAPIGSHFCLSNREASVVHSSTKVRLQKIACVVDNDSGSYSFEEAGEILQGQIRNAPFSKGSMKSAYDVRQIIMLDYNIANTHAQLSAVSYE
jgi:hypothetical protein